MKKVSAPIYGVTKKYFFILLIGIICLIALLYLLNSFIIKPAIKDNTDTFSFFMTNYFNDIWAGCFIAAFANLLIIKKGRYFVSFRFYFIIWIVESIVWEFLRPYILLVFNPFDKTPKFLWSDFIAYAIGTLIFFVIVLIVKMKLKRLNYDKY